jgi:hypothetical protein
MDGMTIEEALPYLKENQNELIGKNQGEIYPTRSDGWKSRNRTAEYGSLAFRPY